MKIGILQAGRSPDALIEEFGDYDDMFVKMLAGRGFDFHTYAVLDNIFPNSVQDADGWLITGSRYGAYENHDWIPPLESLIRDIFAADLPMIGVCFGHQVIAQALGGKVEKYSGGWSVGHVEYALKDGSTLPLNAWHQDQVTQRPDEAKLLGSTEFCENAVLAYGDKVLTMQPHPEMNNDFVDGLIEKRGRGLVPDGLLDQAKEKIDIQVSQSQVADMFEQILKQEK